MTPFVERAIGRAGLGPVLRARRAGEIEAVRASMREWRDADLLALGAIADAVRAEEIGDAVLIHRPAEGHGVFWIDPAGTELDLLRAVAVARIAGPARARIGIDWGIRGLGLAQVALGFGASDVRGPIARKVALPILDSRSSIGRQEVALLVTHAGRVPVFAEALDVATTEGAAAHA